MNVIEANEEELTRFFGQKPIKGNDKELWVDTISIYTATDGNVNLTFAIEPPNRFFAIIISSNNQTIFEFASNDLKGLKFATHESPNVMRVIHVGETINIQLKPNIRVYQGVAKP